MVETTAIDFRDMLLECTAEIKEAFRDSMLELAEPMIEMELRRTWAQLPDDLKARMMIEQPEAYKELMKHIGG